jgi:mannitol-specific phosphotransferase system IIBC component
MAPSIEASATRLVILACEAGMGSSLMSVNSLKRKLKAANVTDVTVKHLPAREVPANAQLIVAHRGLSGLVRKRAPEAVIVAFDHFLNDPAFEKLVTAFVENGVIVSSLE